MKILRQKFELSERELSTVSKAQDRAFEMIKQHLQEPLKSVEAAGYNRLELACAYLSLAYHALRFGRTKEAADTDFPVLAALACKRVEDNFIRRRKKKLH